MAKLVIDIASHVTHIARPVFRASYTYDSLFIILEGDV